MPMAISLKYTLSMILFQCLHEFEFVILTNCLLKKSYTFDLCMFLGDSKHLTMTFTFFFFTFIFFLSRLKIDIYLIMVFFLVSFISFSKGFFSPIIIVILNRWYQHVCISQTMNSWQWENVNKMVDGRQIK